MTRPVHCEKNGYSPLEKSTKANMSKQNSLWVFLCRLHLYRSNPAWAGWAGPGVSTELSPPQRRHMPPPDSRWVPPHPLMMQHRLLLGPARACRDVLSRRITITTAESLLRFSLWENWGKSLKLTFHNNIEINVKFHFSSLEKCYSLISSMTTVLSMATWTTSLLHVSNTASFLKKMGQHTEPN